MNRADSAAMTLLIISRSGRALAASARRAGYVCDVIDEFADADTCGLARRTYRTNGPLDRVTLEPLLRQWSSDSRAEQAVIVPGSGFEAAPSLLDWLQDFAPVCANPAAVVTSVKDPARFFPLLDSLAIRHPPVHGSVSTDTDPGLTGSWLVKPIGGEGGVGVRSWSADETLPVGCYLQQKVSGQPCSVLFLADGREPRIVGFNLCYSRADLESGREADYRFAAIIGTPVPGALTATIASQVKAVVAATGLRGLCGLDLLWDDDGVSVLEVNPRPPASFELHEHDSSLLPAHLTACRGALPVWESSATSSITGKRVVYAPVAVHIADGMEWPEWTADRPDAGSELAAEAPICTVFATAATEPACRQALQQRHDELLNNIKIIKQPTEFNKLENMKEVTA